jgi:cyclomaltodextrinase
VRDTAERAAAAFFRKKTLPDIPPNGASQGEVFSYHVDRLSPPDWAARTPIYQVFVDRFYPGDGQEWQQTDDLRGIMGGTLWGVRDKLDYIAALNVGCIWLSPTWSTPSHHGYDVTDYYHVAPHLGGEEALHALVDAAHARGLRVLLDMVCNHVSHQHPIFQAALADPASEYRDWFYFEDPASPATADASGPDSAKPTIGYRTFFGVPSMPQINVGHLPARRWLLDIARYWLREFDVDGYRLDYANGPGPGFWSDFRAACRLEKPDCFCFGEIVDQPSALLPYVGRLDGCLDFHIGEALRKTYAYGVWTDADLERFLARHEAYFAATAGNFVRPTFIDNHDMDRFLHAARGNQTALRRAAAVQMRLSGPPIIYYGTEIGLGQRRSKADGFGLEVSREPMMWGSDQNADLLNHYRSLITAWRHRHG